MTARRGDASDPHRAVPTRNDPTECRCGEAISARVHQICDHENNIGSYPGDQIVHCELLAGHADEHEATVYWETPAWEREPRAGEATR